MSQEQLIQQLVALNEAIRSQSTTVASPPPAPVPDVFQQWMQSQLEQRAANGAIPRENPAHPSVDDKLDELEKRFGAALQNVFERLSALVCTLDSRLAALEVPRPDPQEQDSGASESPVAAKVYQLTNQDVQPEQQFETLKALNLKAAAKNHRKKRRKGKP